MGGTPHSVQCPAGYAGGGMPQSVRYLRVGVFGMPHVVVFFRPRRLAPRGALLDCAATDDRDGGHILRCPAGRRDTALCAVFRGGGWETAYCAVSRFAARRLIPERLMEQHSVTSSMGATIFVHLTPLAWLKCLCSQSARHDTKQDALERRHGACDNRPRAPRVAYRHGVVAGYDLYCYFLSLHPCAKIGHARCLGCGHFAPTHPHWPLTPQRAEEPEPI